MSEQTKVDRIGILIGVIINALLLAFSYGALTARMSNSESQLQDIKADIHELRAVVLEKK